MQLAPGQRVGAPLGRGAHRRGCREDLRCLRAGTRRDAHVAPGTVQDQGLVHRHRRRRVGPAARHSARQNRQSAHPVAAETAPQLAGADPLGGAGPLGPLPGRVQRRAARREAGRGPLPRLRLANDALDEVRRRVQNQTLGHRGHKHDPLYRARKLLVSASENITDNGHTKLRGLLDAGDPYGEVRDAWHAKETLRSIYDIDDANLGAATVNQLAQDLQDPAMPPEINRLGRTIWNWRHQISNWHAARVTNAPTEAANNLVKRVKRAAFGFTNFNNYRIRALLYAGKPNWALLDTLTPT